MQARILLIALSETGDPFPEEVQCRLHSGMQPVDREVVWRHFPQLRPAGLLDAARPATMTVVPVSDPIDKSKKDHQ